METAETLKLEIKKLVKMHLSCPERLQYKNFDNVFDRMFKEVSSM